jgi:hypothetical protein
MPAKRRWIDPRTGDYIVERGGPREDTTHASTVVRLLRLRRGSCPLTPEQGFPYDRFSKLGDGVERAIEAEVRETLKLLTGPKLIRDLVVKATIESGTINLRLDFYDQLGAEQTIHLPLARGA